ncbi:hypothetical protein [Streptomyces sp. NPDC055060]
MFISGRKNEKTRRIIRKLLDEDEPACLITVRDLPEHANLDHHGLAPLSRADVSNGLDSFCTPFLKKFRIIDTDEYLLAPGNAWLQGCDRSTADLVCTMAKP